MDCKEKINFRDTIIWLIKSLIIVTAIFTKFEIAPDDGSSYAILVFLAKIRESFANADIVSVIIFGLFYYLHRETAARRIKNDWRIVVLSGIFSVVYVAARSARDLGGIMFINQNMYQYFISGICILGYWFMFELMLRWLVRVFETAETENCSSKAELKLWLTYFAVIFVCWLPWLFSSYPATFCPDSKRQLLQGLGYENFSLNHPLFSTLIMTLCVNIGEALKSRTFGCFIYVAMQTVLGAGIFAYTLVVLRRMGINKKARVAAILFYAVNPVWGVYCQWFEKDLLYVEFYVLTMVLMTEILFTGICSAKKVGIVVCTSVITFLLRNNGFFEIIPFFVIVLIACKSKEIKKRMICITGAAVMIYGVVAWGIYPALNFEKVPDSEMMSIPFQQTARYVLHAGDDVTEYEREVISSVLAYDDFEDDYIYNLSDPVKGKYHGDSESLKQYLRVWLKMGVKHPTIYLDALLDMSYGYLAPVDVFPEPSIDCKATGVTETGIPGITRKTAEIPTALADVFWSAINRVPVLKMFASSGMYSWMLFICAIILLINKKRFEVVLLMPGMVNFLLCIGSAMSSSIRYCLATIALAPVILWWTAIHVCKKENT